MGRQTQTKSAGRPFLEELHLDKNTSWLTEQNGKYSGSQQRQHSTKLNYQRDLKSLHELEACFCVCLAIGREAVNCSSSQCQSTHQTKLRKQKKSLRCQHRSHKSYGTGSFLAMAGVPRTRISCGFHLYPGQEAAHLDLQTELRVSSGSKDFMFGTVVTWDFQVGCTEDMSS